MPPVRDTLFFAAMAFFVLDPARRRPLHLDGSADTRLEQLQ